MPNISSIYTEATGKAQLSRDRMEKEVSSSISPTEQQLSIQEEINWFQNPVTTKFFKELREKVNSLELEAREQSLTFHQHNNYQLIITKLIQAATLRKEVLDKHATRIKHS